MAVSGWSVKVARDALRSNREQFALAGPVLEPSLRYSYDTAGRFSGIEVFVAHAGRASTFIESVSLEAGDDRVDEVIEEPIQVGETRRFYFGPGELRFLRGAPLGGLRAVVSTGHGEFRSSPLEGEMLRDVERLVTRAPYDDAPPPGEG